MTGFGIGTNLVTCQKQPALGMVYKLVELDGKPKIKFSEEIGKIPVPARKNIYRIYTNGKDFPAIDVLSLMDEDIKVGDTIKVRHFLKKGDKFVIKVEKIEKLLNLVWDGKVVGKLPNLHEARDYCEKQVKKTDPEIMHPTKPKSYKVYLTDKLYNLIDNLIEQTSIWKDLK